MIHPNVTVITVVKDLLKNKREKMFVQCAKSVYKQTCPHIEHLIIDGASEDGTIAFLKRYQKQFQFDFISSPDVGIYDAMNKGVSHAKGEYVIFLNSDDYFENIYAVQKAVDALQNTNATFAFGIVDMINESQTLTFYPFEPLFLCSMPFSHQSMFCRRSVLEKYKFNTKFRLAGDIDLIQRLYLDGHTSVDTKWKIAVYRMSGLSYNNQNACYKEYANVFQKNFSPFGHYSLDTCEYIARNFQIPSKLLQAIRTHIFSKNEEMGKRLFNSGAFSISSTLRNNLKRVLKKFVPKTFFCQLHQRYIDYVDKEISTQDHTLYFLNFLPILKIQRCDSVHLLKISVLGITVFKRKNAYL